MIENLKPYPGYRESGLTWLDTIPAHWRTERNGNLFQQRNETQHPDLPVLEVSLRTGVRVREFGGSKRKQVMADAGKYKRAAVGDLAYNMMRMWQGAVGEAPVDGLVSPAYVVARPFPGTRVRYYTSLFRNGVYMGEIDAASRGIVKDRNRLYWGQFKQMRSLVPPPEEQAAIVRFLDHANWKFDGFIRAKRKLIGLLNEQKQAIIHRAVTRGLDSAVPMKTSGLDWLGEIPAHWRVLRAKYVFREVDERSQSGNEELLSVSHITGVTPRSQKNITMFKAESYVGHKVCRPGDLTINTMWAWMAALGFSNHHGIISPAYAVYRQREPEQVIPAYGDLLLRTSPYKAEYLARSTGVRSSRLRLYPEEVFKIPVLIPPKDEQERIIDEVCLETSSVNDAIARTEREIALMQEYRTRLTADVVTGKLDVRTAAADLPDLGGETPDEVLAEDDLAEDDESFAEAVEG